MNNSDDSMNGALDDFYVYSRALSAADINELYLATIPEPATMIFLVTGTIGFLSRRRVRNTR